jgi:hypothetical protein
MIVAVEAIAVLDHRTISCFRENRAPPLSKEDIPENGFHGRKQFRNMYNKKTLGNGR